MIPVLVGIGVAATGAALLSGNDDKKKTYTSRREVSDDYVKQKMAELKITNSESEISPRLKEISPASVIAGAEKRVVSEEYVKDKMKKNGRKIKSCKR